MRPTKNETFMAIARALAARTTCIRRAVGCVLVDPRGRIVGTGYNGVAAGMPHCNAVHYVLGPTVSASEEVVKRDGIDVSGCSAFTPFACAGHDLPPGRDRCEAVHAEQNALLSCRDPDAIDTCYVTTFPCLACAKLLLNTSCATIVYADDHPHAAEVQAFWQRAGCEWRRLVA